MLVGRSFRHVLLSLTEGRLIVHGLHVFPWGFSMCVKLAH